MSGSPHSVSYASHYAALGNAVPDWDAASPYPRATPWLRHGRDREIEILDLGCGFGGMLSRLHAAGYTRLTGVDSDAVSLARAQVAAGRRAKLVAADARDWLSAHPDGYDLILAFDLVEHLPGSEVVDFLAQIRQSLRAGGHFALRTPNLQTLGGSYSRYLDLTHRIGFTEVSLRQAFTLAGFPEPAFLPDPVEPWGKGWRLWTPWRGLRLRTTLNHMLHQFVYALRDQRPRPTRFAINLEAWAVRGGAHE